MTPAAVGPYSPVVRVGRWLFCSGQIGMVEGKMVPGGVEPELHQVFENLTTVLASEGATLANVVKTTVYLVDIQDYAVMNAIYSQTFDDHRPARTAVAVAALPFGAHVEIEAWARL